MHSRLVTLLFALLLLGMQQHAQQHALAHFGEQLHRSHDQALQLPTDETPCTTCALYAGGSTALPTDGETLDAAADTFVAPLDVELSAALSPPAYYLSRAPPSPR